MIGHTANALSPKLANVPVMKKWLKDGQKQESACTSCDDQTGHSLQPVVGRICEVFVILSFHPDPCVHDRF